jgi:hypothetical protein
MLHHLRPRAHIVARMRQEYGFARRCAQASSHQSGEGEEWRYSSHLLLTREDHNLLRGLSILCHD